jgi:tetratricopeptide (TPR) repeat protein
MSSTTGMRCVAVVLAFCLALSARADAQDWSVHRDPFDASVVRRYKAILARDPHDVGALRELVGMYKRYRTVAKLEEEYRTQLGSTQDWATLVVLARLPRVSRTDTIALWNRALVAKPDDAAGWLALGDLAPDAAASRDAFQRAATFATKPAQKRLALTKLVAAARSAGDHKSIDGAYAELIALAPKDGLLWLERGNAQLAAGQTAEAAATFATAEGLLARDPERRLTAMVNQGIALERLGRIDDAIAQWLRTLDKTPRGYFLGTEIVPRIIDAERKRGRVAAAISLFEKRWPERSRGYVEWDTLGDLYKETGDEERAIASYRHAVKKAPTEVVTQRKLIQLLDKLHPTDALAQHEAAARVAPGDPDLHIELAKRYRPTNTDKAFSILEKLSKRMSRNINVRRSIAELYMGWEQPLRAAVEYEAIAALEPGDPDHVVVLGDAYWLANEQLKARAAWEKLTRIGTAASTYRHGEVLTMHELWDDAVIAYTKSLALDATNINAWYGRARANDELHRFAAAVDDSRRAVALIGRATREDGTRERHLLVKVLGHWHAVGNTALASTLLRWRFAFDRGDVAAGYLLAAHHARLGSRQLHGVLVDLRRRVPTDDSVGIALAHSFSSRHEFDRAHDELEAVGRRSPARTKEVDRLLEQLGAERARYEQEVRWKEEGKEARARQAGGGPDLAARRRFGTRLGLGTDVHNGSGALLAVGIYRTYRVADATAFTLRGDWAKHDAPMHYFNAFEIGGTISRRLVDARKFEMTAGIGPRLELRYGRTSELLTADRGAVSGDVTVEIMPRALPMTIGVRLKQSLTETSHSSALLLELGLEVR